MKQFSMRYSNLIILSVVLYERSLFFIDLKSVEIFEIGSEMKLRTGQENSVKKATFLAISGVSVYLGGTNFDHVQMTFYVKLLDTCHEKNSRI